MNRIILIILTSFLITLSPAKLLAQNTVHPADITFTRQGVQRLIFDPEQSILLAKLHPASVVGLAAMHPRTTYSRDTATVSVIKDQLIVQSPQPTETGIWLGACNPFATYSVRLATTQGEGAVGFEFAHSGNADRFQIFMTFAAGRYHDVVLKVIRNRAIVLEKSILTNPLPPPNGSGELILQMLGSGLNVYLKESGLPVSIAQADFNQTLDLRRLEVMHSFQARLLFILEQGAIAVAQAQSALTTGVGQADIRAITHKDGSAFLDQGRLWYTLSVRGRALDHHVQGVFSLSPTAFDLKLEGIMVFDRGDGLLRNEISSHVFYDDDAKVWRGFTTGFSFAANPQVEKSKFGPSKARLIPGLGFL